MFRTNRVKSLIGVATLAVAGSAFANTSLDAVTTGDLFLNIVDTTNNTSFLYDTGISQASFTGNTGESFNLSSDANLKAFLNATDTFDYSVISATKTGTAATIDFSGGANPLFPTPSNPTSFNLGQAQAAIKTFLTFANSVTSSTTNSAIVPTGNAGNGYYGAPLNEGIVSARLFNASQTPYADNAAFGTPLSFFQAAGTVLTTFAGTWNFSATTDILSYATGGSTPPPPPPTVPLPGSLLLLLSGIGVMGGRSLARRNRAAPSV